MGIGWSMVLYVWQFGSSCVCASKYVFTLFPNFIANWIKHGSSSHLLKVFRKCMEYLGKLGCILCCVCRVVKTWLKADRVLLFRYMWLWLPTTCHAWCMSFMYYMLEVNLSNILIGVTLFSPVTRIRKKTSSLSEFFKENLCNWILVITVVYIVQF